MSNYEDMTDTEKLGLLIQATRKKRGLSQEQLAQKLGMQRENISKIEKGKQSPTYETLAPILRELDLIIIPIEALD